MYLNFKVSFICLISVNSKLLCIFRGSWIESVAEILEDEADVDNPPFLHVHYVVSEEHLASGMRAHTILRICENKVFLYCKTIWKI